MKQKFVYQTCGCEFDILDNTSDRPHILFDIDIANINLECEKTWKLLSDGNTKGCFQLESRLGQSLAKKLKPENIEQLAALISIMRPGCLEAIRNNKSVTDHYIDKKNGLESIDYFHPSLETILNKTYGEMIYQEQAMQIAQKISGFDLKEADMLRKAIGKKKPEEMAKLKQRFIDGAVSLGVVGKTDAEELFSWIEKSQRYSFNKSHAVSYAFNAYLSAYAKAHFPKIFFVSYLSFAKDKIDPQREIRELVANALDSDIEVAVPDLRLLSKTFSLKDNTIYFGLTDIKGFGESVFDKLIDIANQLKAQNKNISDMNIIELYLHVLLKINSIGAKALIGSGATSFIKLNRKYMLYVFDIFSKFSDRECKWIVANLDLSKFKKIEDFLEFIISIPVGRNSCFSSQKRQAIFIEELSMLKNPPYSLSDSVEWLSDSEHRLLGASVTCSKVDGCDIMNANTNCKDFKTTLMEDIILACEIQDLSVIKTKKGKTPGQNMCFMRVSDSTSSLDGIVCFPEQYKEFEHLLITGNTIMINGKKNKKDNSLIIKKIWQI